VVAVAAAGAMSAAVDLHARRVPNWLTLAIAAAGFAIAATGRGAGMAAAGGGLAVGLCLMLPGYLFGATGAGDVKLFAAIGTLLGPAGTGSAFVYTALAGGVLAVWVAIQRRRLATTVDRMSALVRTAGANVADIEHESSDNRFAYAPAIAVGTVIAALGG
jgi:prepilin peptidase CpaA